jgi:hypothetical protein
MGMAKYGVLLAGTRGARNRQPQRASHRLQHEDLHQPERLAMLARRLPL